ncbi:WSC domain-containing protein 1 [Lamellibrachia satsuma]|nr:WSC domain-containing protein 1 [Lamellibrachia satsuma]
MQCVYTGSVYYDAELEKAGFLGENVTDSRVVVIKTHREMELREYDRAILIIRDPYDAIVSEYNWRVCGNHLGRAYSHVYNTTTWHEFVNKSAEYWHRVNSRWLNDFQGVVQIVFYDDMVSDLATSLRTILAFLDVPETRVYCALRSPNGSFKRKSTNVVSRELFTYTQRRTIDGYQESVYEFVTQQQARLRARMLQK